MVTEMFYKEISIPKKRLGEYRDISIPAQGLKYIQRWILDNILYNIPVSEVCTGFVKEKSIIDNAKKHINKDCVINMDIKDFFPSITYNDVFFIFKYYGYTNEVSFLLSKLCSYKGSLPQGAPTSPYISNIISYKLDVRFMLLAKKLKADYSRYADDITISGNKYLVKYLKVFKNILIEEGFKVNERKTRIQYSNKRQEVTGIIVNNKLSVPKETKQYLRQQIYYCKRFGVNSHLARIGIQKSNYKEHLYGMAFFIKMIQQEEGENMLNNLNDIDWDY
ncbi:RNA-directed DNA polymerase [Paenibacillus nuruki]|uniref:RNA-directed DNA polymerase n=2 Tax=Paenibacillus nuruki TaxID=1886670 RepID=A0A1E3L3R9_9BACL|nr:RNA-directed DNA polymerase [Paenibacillus nuruki]